MFYTNMWSFLGIGYILLCMPCSKGYKYNGYNITVWRITSMQTPELHMVSTVRHYAASMQAADQSDNIMQSRTFSIIWYAGFRPLPEHINLVPHAEHVYGCLTAFSNPHALLVFSIQYSVVFRSSEGRKLN